MYEFKLPDIGEGVVEAEVVTWLVKEGDVVSEEQPIVEVMTDKATVEISSPKHGRVHRLLGREGEIVQVGDSLIEIDDDDPAGAKAGESVESTTLAGRAQRERAEPSDGGESVRRSNHPPRMPERPHLRVEVDSQRPRSAEAVPAVRHLAAQLNVDIDRIRGTGPGGRVMRRDVELFAESGKGKDAAEAQAAAAPNPDEPDWSRRPLRGLRRVIAERLAHSMRTIPHFTYMEEVDVTTLEERRAALSAEDRISLLAFVARSVVQVLPDYPALNSSIDPDTDDIINKERIRLGIAVATKEGLMVPVIHESETLGAMELAEAIEDLSTRARSKKLRPDELKGSTFTISSLGKMGGVMATPIINYPEAAIMGVHAIRKLPRYVGDEIEPRQILNLSMSFDHRLVDGHEGAQFVRDVKEMLEQGHFPELDKDE